MFPRLSAIELHDIRRRSPLLPISFDPSNFLGLTPEQQREWRQRLFWGDSRVSMDDENRRLAWLERYASTMFHSLPATLTELDSEAIFERAFIAAELARSSSPHAAAGGRSAALVPGPTSRPHWLRRPSDREPPSPAHGRRKLPPWGVIWPSTRSRSRRASRIASAATCSRRITSPPATTTCAGNSGRNFSGRSDYFAARICTACPLMFRAAPSAALIDEKVLPAAVGRVPFLDNPAQVLQASRGGDPQAPGGPQRRRGQRHRQRQDARFPDPHYFRDPGEPDSWGTRAALVPTQRTGE